MTAYTEVEALAEKAVTDPSSLETTDVLRLGAFITDRAAHVRAHHQAIALQREMDQPTGGSPLMRRIQGTPGLRAAALQSQEAARTPETADPAPVAAIPADTSGEVDQHADQEV